MNIIAKPVETVQENNGQYELFNTVTMKGVNGEEVDVLQSIGQYSLDQLELEKQNYLAMVAEIDKKIEAINSLQQQ